MFYLPWRGALAGIEVTTGKDNGISLIKQADDWQKEQAAEFERMYDASR